ncbi:MAG: aminoacyl-tRNA hydrolase [Clostridium sp.]|jgi:PTH1 family peptidyl-tRNA hydrolase|nr:aminoacyl-tRNA hydrolase [Clostridium sp.]
MYLIVGLGNPEIEYANTRHNMGFDAINHLSRKLNINVNKEKFKGIYGDTILNGEKVILLKPQTYMNLSGESIIQFKQFYKIPPENIIVIYDDIDVDVGKIKIRKKGGPGSHNGMKSVVKELKSEDFPRIRVGIGKPMFKEMMIGYVLEKLNGNEREILEESTKLAANAVYDIITSGIDKAMNKYN